MVGWLGQVGSGSGACGRAIAHRCSTQEFLVSISVGGGICGRAEVMTLVGVGAVGASGGFEDSPKELLSGMLVFGIVSVSRSQAN